MESLKGLEKKMLNASEAAVLLGKTPTTVIRWIKAGTLDGVKLGRSWMIRKSDIDRIVGNDTEKDKGGD